MTIRKWIDDSDPRLKAIQGSILYHQDVIQHLGVLQLLSDHGFRNGKSYRNNISDPPHHCLEVSGFGLCGFGDRRPQVVALGHCVEKLLFSMRIKSRNNALQEKLS